jgi:hypothetical protein
MLSAKKRVSEEARYGKLATNPGCQYSQPISQTFFVGRGFSHAAERGRHAIYVMASSFIFGAHAKYFRVWRLGTDTIKFDRSRNSPLNHFLQAPLKHVSILSCEFYLYSLGLCSYPFVSGHVCTMARSRANEAAHEQTGVVFY